MILFIQLSSQNWCIWLKYTSYCSEILANGLLCKLSAYAFNACLISIYAFIIIDVCCKVLKCQSVHRLAFNGINALALSANQTTVQMAQMAAAMEQHAAFAQRPRAQPLPRLESKSFTRLNIESGSESHKISTLCAWEAAIRYNVDSFDSMREDLPLVRVISAILGSLEGTARTMSQGMDVNRYAENNPANAGRNKLQLFETFLVISVTYC